MNLQQYYKNFLTLFSGNAFAQFIPFIVAPIISRIYSPEEIGTFSNFFALVSLFGIVAVGRFELAIPIVKDKKVAQNLVFSGLVFLSVTTIFSCIIANNDKFFSSLYKDEQLGEILWLLPISVFSFGILLLLTNWLLRLKNYKIISLNKIIQAIINNGFSVGFGVIKWGSIGLMLSWLLSNIIAGLFLLKKITLKTNRPKSDFNFQVLKSTVVEYKDFPLINSLHAFMDVFATQFLLFWIVTITFGNYEFGIYALMFKYIRGPIGLITHSLSQLFYVEVSDRMNNKQPIKHLFFRSIKMSSVFAIIFSVVLLLFGQKLFALYLGEEWKAGGIYAQCILPILFLTFIVSPISGLTILFRKQFIGFILSLLCYTFSLLSFVVGIKMNFSFSQALLIYSTVYSLYFIVILLWYNHMINKYEKSIL